MFGGGQAEILARTQGGVLADGINSVIACMCGSPPNTTFSQNNGIIALTRCASRSAGFACAGWLIFIGLFGKVRAPRPRPCDRRHTRAQAARRHVHRMCTRRRLPLTAACAPLLPRLVPLTWCSAASPPTHLVLRCCLASSAQIGAAMATIPMPIVGGVILQCFTMVFVAGMQILGPLLSVRRNSFIVMLSLAFGLGVAMEPQVVSSAGSSSFFGKNLDHNHGMWPRSMVCDEFPSVSTVVFPAACAITNSTGGVHSIDILPASCAFVGGVYTPAVTAMVETKTCANNNGLCCKKYDKGLDSLRTSVVLVMKTPYCIAVIIALLLNLILPVEKEEDETSSSSKSDVTSVAEA